jgi:hypothetical protein
MLPRSVEVGGAVDPSGGRAEPGEKPYDPREPPSWAKTVAAFKQRLPEDDDLTTVLLYGECLQCEHPMDVELPIEVRAGKKLYDGHPNDEPLGDRAFVKTAMCNCGGDHEGRPTEVKQGCGAFGRLDVGSPESPRRPAGEKRIVLVEGGRYTASPGELAWERRAEALAPDVLARVRAQAEKWTATVSSLTGIFGIVALIKGPEDVGKLGAWSKYGVIGFLALAIFLAAYATYGAAKAAYGFPDGKQVVGAVLRRREREEARRARNMLRWSILAALGAVVALALGIGITWIASPKETSPLARVLVLDGDGVAVCGELQSAPAGERRLLILEPKAKTPKAVATSAVRGLSSVAKCPGE